MDDEGGFSFGDFAVEMQDFEVVRTRKWDRIWRIGPGGSVTCGILIEGGRAYFGSHNHFFYCIDASSGSEIWRFKASEQIHNGAGPVIRNGIVYFGSYDHMLYALYADTGRLAWKFQTQGEISAGPCADDERVYFGSRDNHVYALDLETGALRWKFSTGDCVAGVPAVHGDRLLVGSFDMNFYCLDKRSGSLLWKFPTQGEIFNYTRMLVHEGAVHFASFDNFLRAVDVKTGKLLWRFQMGVYGVSAGTVLHNGMLIQGSRDGNLYALTPGGRLLWKFSTHEMIIPVACHKDRIYFGCEDQNLYCLDLSGKERWRFRTQGLLTGQQAIWNDRIYFGSYDCNMYCVDLENRSLAWKFSCGGSPSYIPPPNESFELRLKASSGKEERQSKKGYELDLSGEDEKVGGFYKARVTYGGSSRYREKGSYGAGEEDGL